jgi:hypothetical protein
MTPSNERKTMAQPYSFMPVVGAVVLAALAVYFVFMAVDGMGLSDQSGTAVVVGKQYRKSHETYTTERFGDTNVTRPSTVPEMYILELTIDGKPAAAAVEKSLFDAATTDDRMTVTYQRRRLTGTLQVTGVSR